MEQENTNYYYQKLNSQKLYQVYATDIPRIRQYLNEEIGFVRNQLHGKEKVLEVGSGYGRIIKVLAPCVESVVGIDISKETIDLGKEYLNGLRNVTLSVMDVHKIEFEGIFDVVLCLQNGLSAMKGEPNGLIMKCMKALNQGGKGFFSTYCEKFWNHRLAWFEEQANKGLLGEIDKNQTKDGVIVCKDGFRAITFTEADLLRLGQMSGYAYRIQEVDESSLFLIITKS
jgi:2-polyprenyl-6-hydroxyphenyl methylase/3-demethylubiquinone-9 3-methyltransferase